mgnify:CR=1 FL=1
MDLHGSTLTENVDFSNAYIEKINIRNANIKYVTFDHATIREAVFEDVTFMQEASFKGTEFEEAALFSRSVFIKDAHFRSVKFVKVTNFSNAKFKQYADFAGTSDNHSKFGTRADFQGVKFLNGANFCFSEFHSNDFRYATFADYINFKNVDFFQRAEFIQIRKSDDSKKKLEIEFSGHLHKGGLFEARDAETKLILSSTEFVEDTSFKGPFLIDSCSKTTFNKGATFRHCANVALNNTRLGSHSSFEHIIGDIRCTDVDFGGVDFRNCINVALNNTRLGAYSRFEGIFCGIQCTDVDFVGCADFKGVSGTFDPVEHLKFNDVRFNSDNKEGVQFREYWTLVNGLPKGAQWVRYDRDGNPLPSLPAKQIQESSNNLTQENTFTQVNPGSDNDNWATPR